MPKLYFVVGVYPDGTRRKGHVSTANIARYKSEHLTGILPFAKVFAVPCHNYLTCNHA